MEERTIDIKLIRFDPAIYPRFTQSMEEIKRYAELIKTGTPLPPIKVDYAYRIIDGYHRWQAHLKVGHQEVKVVFVECRDNFEALQSACYLNAIQGITLTKEERRKNALRLYEMARANPSEPSEDKMRDIARAVGVSCRTIYRWTEELRRRKKQEIIEKATELRRQGKTQQATAQILGVHRSTISRIEKRPDVQNCYLTASHRPKKDLDFTSRRQCLAAMGQLVECNEDLPSREIIQNRLISNYNRIKMERERYGIDMETYGYFKSKIQKHTANIANELDCLSNIIIGLSLRLRDDDLKSTIYSMFQKVSTRFEEFRKQYLYVAKRWAFDNQDDTRKKISLMASKILAANGFSTPEIPPSKRLKVMVDRDSKTDLQNYCYDE